MRIFSISAETAFSPFNSSAGPERQDSLLSPRDIFQHQTPEALALAARPVASAAATPTFNLMKMATLLSDADHPVTL